MPNTTMQITTRSDYDTCVRVINESVKEFLLDQPQIAEDTAEDEIWADMAAALLTEAAPKVAEEVCRCQLGYVPQELRRLWTERLRAKKVADLQRQRDKTAERKAAKEQADRDAVEAERQTIKDNTCPRCFTVKAPSGACNC